MNRSIRLRKSTLFICLAAVATFLPSCRTRSNVIAVIPRTTSTMFWEAEHAGAEFAARKSGVRIRWNAPTRSDDVQLQIGIVERAIKRQCRGLILSPDEPRALMVPVEKALAAGIPTVIVGSALSLPAQPNLYYIVNDEDMIGRMAAERIGEVLNGSGSVAVVGIDPQSPSSLAILRSFDSVLKDKFPKVSVVDRSISANNDLDSELIVSEVVQSHPTVDAILSLDSMGTAGSYLALKGRSLTNRVKVVGVEQGADLANAVRLRQIDALIAENTYQMGYQAVQLLTSGSNRPRGVIKLPPLLITAANIDAPETKPFITNDWRAEVQ